MFSNKVKVEAAFDDLRFVTNIEGQISEREVITLMDLAASLHAGTTIVEIGSYRGKSTLALAFGSRRGYGNKVYAVDPHLDFIGVLGAIFGPNDLKALYQNIVAANVGDTVFVVSLPSVEASKAWQSTSIELLFIDGDHSYDGVKSDYESWIPYVVKNGLIAFHDCNVAGVKQLIDKLNDSGLVEFIEKIDELAWFKKK